MATVRQFFDKFYRFSKHQIDQQHSMTTTCKNCNYDIDRNFCSNCGQTVHTHEIDFKSILHEIQHSILHVDKGILYTTKELFTRPGHTIREYLEGKRVKHFKPLAYILILSTIYNLLTNLTKEVSFIENFFQGMIDSREVKKESNLFVDTLKWMNDHYAYSTMIFIPITSIASYLAFFKTKYNYFQHLILNSFIAGQKTIIFLGVLPVAYLFDRKKETDIDDFASIILITLLTFWTYFQFFSTTTPIKKILLTILTYVLIAVLFLVSVILIFATAKILAST